MSFLEHIKSELPQLDEIHEEILKNYTYTKTFGTKEILLNQGQKCQFVGYVLGGSLRTFHLTKNGSEQTLYFALENDWITSYFSYLTQTGSDVFIQSLEESTVEFLSRKTLNKLYEKSLSSNVVGRKVAEQIYIQEYKRNKDLLNLDATQRYKKLFAEKPEIIQRVKLQYIASFLGITKESLSRIRREIT